jgi:hypothetical protein
MHNGLLVDPMNPFQRRIKELARKGAKKLTDSDYEQIDRLKWEGGLYFDENVGPFVPNDNIEATILAGARKSRQGKETQAAVFVSDEIVKLDYKGPRTMEALYVDKRFQLRKRVTIGKAAVIGVRPMFPTGWSIDFEIEFDDSVINRKDVIKAMEEAGKLCGLGDWRPKFGRFVVDVLN